jgi:uncharacterized protein (AIM24 family)
MQQVTFTRIRDNIVGVESESFTCRETGIRYQLETHRSLGLYSIFGDEGIRLAMLDGPRDVAISFIEQQARLDFHLAQTDCGAWAD